MFSIIAPENIEAATRRAHKKSRGGCKKCKERKLKCDEVKPTCTNCQRRFISITNCEYGHVKPRPITNASSGIIESGERGPKRFNSPRRGNSTGPEIDADYVTPLPNPLSAELLDPFLTHPSTRVNGINILLKYYLSTAVYNYFPWQPASQTNPMTAFFVPLVFRDEVLFHSILHFSAMRMDNTISKSCGINTTFLSAECIRLLRDRVENSNPESGVGLGDETISAVAMLGAVEVNYILTPLLRLADGKELVSERQLAHASIAHEGLVAHGGLERWSQCHQDDQSNDCKLDFLRIPYRMFVVASCEVPYPPLDPALLPFTPADNRLTISIPSSEGAEPPYMEGKRSDFAALGLAGLTANIMSEIQYISQLVPSHDVYPTAENSSVILTRMCSLLSHLLSVPAISPSPQSETSVLITEGVRFAILLHVLTPWRGLPPDGTIAINGILYQLTSILRSIFSQSEDPNNVLVLWMFAVGGISAANMPERTWFVSHLADLVEKMGITSWEGFKSAMSKCIWHEKLYITAYEKLWGEVSEKQEKIIE